MLANQTSGFFAIGAIALGPLGSNTPKKPVLPHTNQFELGKVDQKGCFCPCKPPEGKSDAKWTVNNPGNGKADIDLGNYTLQLDEKNSQIKIVNKNNGEVTNIWGDPHVDWNKDGKTDVDFWGKTTFQLEDGTKITIDTEKFKNNPNEYVASEVTVTRGDNALKITGISQNELGDLKVEYADRGGQLLDWATTDGFTVKENANGEGWINPDTGKMATQKEFDVTKPGAAKPYEFTQEFGQQLGLYLLSGMFGGGLERIGRIGEDGGGWQPGKCRQDPPKKFPPEFRPPFTGGPVIERPVHGGPAPDRPVIKPLPVTPGRDRGHVHQTDANTITIHHPGGAVDTRSGGSLAWRTNNPGLLPFNANTRSLGAIGEVDGVAVFRNEDAGRSALQKLMCGHR